MGIIRLDKWIDPPEISCGDLLHISVRLKAEPDRIPADILLLADCSRSSSGLPCSRMKEALSRLLRRLTDPETGRLLPGFRLALLPFSEVPLPACPFTDDPALLSAAFSRLSAKGCTDHDKAFCRAAELFPSNGNSRRILILLSDGIFTAGKNPDPAAQRLKEEGTEIFAFSPCPCAEGTAALTRWVSSPSSAHLLQNLEETQICSFLAEPFPENLQIREQVADCFSILSARIPEGSRVMIQNRRELLWSIPDTGILTPQNNTLIFTVLHEGEDDGLVPVTRTVCCSDSSGSSICTSHTPEVLISCRSKPLLPDDPVPDEETGRHTLSDPWFRQTEMTFPACETFLHFDAGEISPSSPGRIVQLDLTVTDVCPGRKTALAVFLYELDETGKKILRGCRSLTLPAHSGPGCRDLTVPGIPFILPEENTLCSPRRLLAAYTVHYIDYTEDMDDPDSLLPAPPEQNSF